MMFDVFAEVFVIFVACYASYYLGRREGIDAERLRAMRVFDVALGIVSSGALHKVRRRISGEYRNDNELRVELVRECEERARARRWG